MFLSLEPWEVAVVGGGGGVRGAAALVVAVGGARREAGYDFVFRTYLMQLFHQK